MHHLCSSIQRSVNPAEIKYKYIDGNKVVCLYLSSLIVSIFISPSLSQCLLLSVSYSLDASLSHSYFSLLPLFMFSFSDLFSIFFPFSFLSVPHYLYFSILISLISLMAPNWETFIPQDKLMYRSISFFS